MDSNLNWKLFEPEIQRLASLNYNYDVNQYLGSTNRIGWNIDHYEGLLDIESPGQPLIHGPFAAAREALIFYKFPDPHLIRAVFDPEVPLAGRNMLMFAKFLGFTFTFGVRITEVIDTSEVDRFGSEIKIWGYAYRTLAGHFEVGEIRFELKKNIRTGEVFFVINAYSKPDRIPNFFYRVGFKLFGRTLQKYFAQSSIKRLSQIAHGDRKY